jgi:hypothetical protein
MIVDVPQFAGSGPTIAVIVVYEDACHYASCKF